MNPSVSVFLDFNLPNGTTWFYFSWLLAIALFFKFSRLLTIRNWDIVTLFLLVPGLLIIQKTHADPGPSEAHAAVQAVELIGQSAGLVQGSLTAVGWFGSPGRHPALTAGGWLWWGYLWLLCGSGYFFLRCLMDLTLVQRPALAPNLTFGGLVWFSGALLICLGAVAFRAPERNLPLQVSTSQGVQTTTTPIGPESAMMEVAREQFGAEFWLLRAFAVVGHIVVCLGLIFIGRWHFHDPAAGMAAATLYLMSPYTGLFVGQAHHVWPMALVIWALVTYKTPMLSGSLLGLAAGTMYFPVVLFPVWASFYWKRGAGRFLLMFLVSAAVCLAIVGLTLWFSNDLDTRIRETFQQNAWQAWKIPNSEGFWTGTHWAYRIPIFIAYTAFVILTAFWPAPKNLAHVIALSAAVLIGIQFWYADQGGVYVLWYLPLLLLLVFRPNLEMSGEARGTSGEKTHPAFQSTHHARLAIHKAKGGS